MRNQTLEQEKLESKKFCPTESPYQRMIRNREESKKKEFWKIERKKSRSTILILIRKKMFNYKEWLEERENGGKRLLKWHKEHDKKCDEANKKANENAKQLSNLYKKHEEKLVEHEENRDYDDYKDEMLEKEVENSRI